MTSGAKQALGLHVASRSRYELMGNDSSGITVGASSRILALSASFFFIPICIKFM